MSYSARRSSASIGIAALTPRERQALELYWQGHGRKSAARALGVSPRTVEVHWGSVRSKLGVSKTLLAARMLARSEGWQP